MAYPFPTADGAPSIFIQIFLTYTQVFGIIYYTWFKDAMIHIYHPNKAVKGSACSFWYSDRDDALYATIIKQAGWDANSQTGTFKDSLNDANKKVSIKLSAVEACAILDCIERNRGFTGFHSSDEFPKAISFVPWMSSPVADEDGNKPAPAQKGYSFSVVVNSKADPTNKNSFYIGLTFAEARYVREFILFAIQRTFVKRDAAKPATPAEDPSKL